MEYGVEEGMSSNGVAGLEFSGEWPKRLPKINNTSLQKGLLIGLSYTFLSLSYTKIMARVRIPPQDLSSLSLSNSDAEDIEDPFASPSVPTKPRRPEQRSDPQPPAHPPEPDEDHLAAYEASLRYELSSVRTMNQVVSGVVDSLAKAKSNMETISATVSNASTLLSTWTRILSQTEHNQRLILNPRWQGASQDIVDGENEVLLRRQENEIREVEEAKREEARLRENEEEERRRLTQGPTTKGPRGRGRGGGRGVSRAGGNEYIGVGGQGGVRGTARVGGTTPGRAGSGIGRGIGSARGRAKGLMN